MRIKKPKYEIKTYRNDEVNFIRLVDDLQNGKPWLGDKPLRRTLSLMRRRQFETMVLETIDWQTCCEKHRCFKSTSAIGEEDQRAQSCSEYNDILENKYKIKLIKKTCLRFSFFSKRFKQTKIIKTLSNDELIGYCIVHQDTRQKNSLAPDVLTYITESIIRQVPKSNEAFAFGSGKHKVDVFGHEFSIEGNYFSQQNRATNSCAHAAIKMAVRTYQNDVTAEEINRAVGINHEGDRKGWMGMTPKQVKLAITKLTGLNAFSIQSSDFPDPILFLKAVYLAVESRLPVILILSVPQKNPYNHRDQNEQSKVAGDTAQDGIVLYEDGLETDHAITIVGHTFNRHSWYAYGIGGYYLRDREEVEPLSSFLWCDNFIVQDDNFGPFYLLPASFVTQLIAAENIVKSLRSMTDLPVEIFNNWSLGQLSAIIVHPKTTTFAGQELLVEPYAFWMLESFVEGLRKPDKKGKIKLPDKKDFRIYFFDYYEDRYNPHKTSLILRTTIVEKDQYIKSHCKLFTDNKILSSVRNKLPQTFYLTEISIPELFWTNQCKVGEIITSPYKLRRFARDLEKAEEHKFKNNPGVILIRIPYYIALLKDDIISMEKPLEQEGPYQKVFEAAGLKRK
jgi:hypothetical protein